MKISKKDAIGLLREKREMFEKISDNPDYKHPLYHKAYYGTAQLLTTLFSEKEAADFKRNVNGFGVNIAQHIQKCIDEIDIFIEIIEKTWPEEGKEDELPKEHFPLPFISMSFADEDREINEYFLELMKALDINYLSGREYSMKSVP